MRLRDLQTNLHDWRVRNFPTTSSHGHQFLGMVEEMGELAHAILKQSQGIRGSFDEHEAAMKDSVADVVIFLLGFCSDKGWDLEDILVDTASKVMSRDWVANPFDGARMDERSLE